MSLYVLYKILQWCSYIESYLGVSAVAAGGLPSVPTAVDNVVRDGRQNKKSKWDKVLTCLCICHKENIIIIISMDSLSHCFI